MSKSHSKSHPKSKGAAKRGGLLTSLFGAGGDDAAPGTNGADPDGAHEAVPHVDEAVIDVDPVDPDALEHDEVVLAPDGDDLDGVDTATGEGPVWAPVIDQSSELSETDGTGRDMVIADEGSVPATSEAEVYATGFTDVANARLWRRSREARRQARDRRRSFRDVFTPTRPKRKPPEFIGRRAAIGTVVEAIEEECAHVVVCAETGLGKTSLANVICTFAQNSGYLVARITGTEDLTFGRLIRTVFEELCHQIEETPAGRVLWDSLGVQDLNELLQDNAMDLVSEFLGEESLDVTRVVRALERLSDHQAIVVVDDYDQIKSREMKTRLVQVMKAMSDQGGWLSFFILGRGESPSELLQDDIDALPNAVGLHLETLDFDEVDELMRDGAQRVGLQFDPDTVQAVARLSQGVPNVVQWLCFLSVRHTIRRSGLVVEIEDLASIVGDAVTKLDAKLRNQYDYACRYEKGNSNADLLYLAVRAPTTPSGLFTAQAMHSMSKQLVGRQWKESEIHTALLPLCGRGDKTILRKLETSEGTFYRFAHPAMRSVVMLKKIVRIPLLSDMRTRDVDTSYLSHEKAAPGPAPAHPVSEVTEIARRSDNTPPPAERQIPSRAEMIGEGPALEAKPARSRRPAAAKTRKADPEKTLPPVEEAPQPAAKTQPKKTPDPVSPEASAPAEKPTRGRKASAAEKPTAPDVEASAAPAPDPVSAGVEPDTAAAASQTGTDADSVTDTATTVDTTVPETVVAQAAADDSVPESVSEESLSEETVPLDLVFGDKPAAEPKPSADPEAPDEPAAAGTGPETDTATGPAAEGTAPEETVVADAATPAARPRRRRESKRIKKKKRLASRGTPEPVSDADLTSDTGPAPGTEPGSAEAEAPAGPGEPTEKAQGPFADIGEVEQADPPDQKDLRALVKTLARSPLAEDVL